MIMFIELLLSGGIDMKTFKYIGLAGFTLLTVSSLFGAKSVTAIEKAKYTVLEKEDGFEIRQYDPQIVAETFVAGQIKTVGNEGFTGSITICPTYRSLRFIFLTLIEPETNQQE